MNDAPPTTRSAVEAHGIDLIPVTERHGRPRDLFGMWAGTNLNVFYVVNGAVIISLGLSFGQSILAILLGNLAFLAVGLTSLQGPKTGTSSFAVSRAAFGPRGGRILAAFNWVTCVGFEASGLALVVLAVLAMLDRAGIGDGVGVKIAVILLAAAVQGVLPLLGHATILGVQRKLAWVSAVLFLVMAVFVAPQLKLGSLGGGQGWEPITLAIALVVSGGGLSWANTGSDYSRYLPEGASPRKVFWFASLGGYIPATLLEILGAGVASVVKTASDPISGVPSALPGWIAIPYLIFIAVTLLAVNSMNLYSSGLTLQAIGLRLARWKCVVLDSVICTALTFFAIFSDSFNTLYTNFLGLLIVWLAPWFAIYAVDAILRRNRYDARALLDGAPGGRYWGRGGFGINALLAQLAGMVAALLWIDATAFTGPLSSATGGSDFSVFAGLLIAGLVYWALAARSVRQQSLDAPHSAVAAARAAFASEVAN